MIIRGRVEDWKVLVDLSPLRRLRWFCQMCGECCRGIAFASMVRDTLSSIMGLPPLSGKDFLITVACSLDEILKISRYIGIPPNRFSIPIGGFLDGQGRLVSLWCGILRSSHGCVFLRNNKCMVHSVKPVVCKLYPFINHKLRWDYNGKTLHVKVDVFRVCPNIGRGPRLRKKQLSKIGRDVIEFIRQIRFGGRGYRLEDVSRLWPYVKGVIVDIEG